jgi:hypothetical protein
MCVDNTTCQCKLEVKTPCNYKDMLIQEAEKLYTSLAKITADEVIDEYLSPMLPLDNKQQQQQSSFFYVYLAMPEK